MPYIVIKFPLENRIENKRSEKKRYKFEQKIGFYF